MNRLKQLIHEIRLWQVLGSYLAFGWVVLQAVDTVSGALSLQDWVAPLALFLLVLGLPIVLVTAFVQKGISTMREAAPVDEAASGAAEPRPTSGARRLFTWRNAIAGGVVAFTGLGVLSGAYWVMWATGIGPVGNLLAKGVIEEGARVVLATFDDATAEDLGNVVTEALRIDLLQASVLDLVEGPDILPALDRMEVPVGMPFTAELAREVAIREGIPAVLDGDVASAGSGYILTATLRSSESGRSLANFRVTADGQDEIIRAIEKLSQDIREKSGESLGSIRAGKPLEQVTTSSLEALKLYTEATGIWSGVAEERTIPLLEQALAQDSTFAMAWRILAISYNNAGLNPEGLIAAATMAFRHRDRLDDLERYLVQATYHSMVSQDVEALITAYQNALSVDPDSRIALNNLALVYASTGNLAASEQLLLRAVGGPGRTGTAYTTLLGYQLVQGRVEEAAALLGDFEAAYPGHSRLPEFRFWVAFMQGDLTEASEHATQVLEAPGETARARAQAAERLGLLAYWSGRLDQGRELYLRSERLAAQSGPANGWLARLLTAYDEALLGEEEWARRHLYEAVRRRCFRSVASSRHGPLEHREGARLLGRLGIRGGRAPGLAHSRPRPVQIRRGRAPLRAGGALHPGGRGRHGRGHGRSGAAFSGPGLHRCVLGLRPGLALHPYRGQRRGRRYVRAGPGGRAGLFRAVHQRQYQGAELR